jgi:hypothetical protein
VNDAPSATQRDASRLVALTVALYRWLLWLHPAAFRREYSVSICQVFAQSCRDAYRASGAAGVARLWLPALGDLLHGALAEHLDALKGSYPMLEYRRSLSAVFGAYIAFVIAGIGFQKMTEDVMKSSLPSSHPILMVAYVIVEGGAALSLLAVLVGGLPLAWSALRYAFAQRRGDILARFAVPPIALAVVWGYLVFLVHLDPGGATAATIHSPARILAVGSLIAVFVVAAAASTGAVLSAIARSEITPRLYRFARIPGMLLTVAMAGMLLAVVAWVLALWQAAPAQFFGNDGLLASSTILSSLAQVILMLGAIAVAARAIARGMAMRQTSPAA